MKATVFARSAMLALFVLPSLAPASSRAVTIMSNGTGGGLWSSATSWSGGVVPTSNDDVIIVNGDTVTIDSGNALGITVQNGSILQFEATIARTLVVTQSVTIESSGTFRSNTVGTQTGHLLSVGADLTNNGTLDFSTNGNTAGAGITFTGAANNTFGGTGSITNIRAITVNKGTTPASILELNPANFTVRGVATDTVVGGWLVQTNGTIKISGTFAGTSRIFSTATYTIPASCGFWLNNPNYVVEAQAGNVSTSGLLRISQGTFNHGTLNTHSLRGATGASYVIEGGTVNCAGQFSPQNAVSYSQSGGTLNVGTVGNGIGQVGTFELLNFGSTFIVSGGTINLVQASTATGDFQVDYQNYANNAHDDNTNINNITGGTLNVGTAATVNKFRFNIRGNTPALVVDNTMNAKTASVTRTTRIFGNLTVPPGATYDVNNDASLCFGTTVTNNGAITSTGAVARFDFAARAPMTYTGSGTFGTLAAPFSGFGISSNSLSLITLTSPIITTQVNLYGGGFVNSNLITLGNGGSSTAVVVVGFSTAPASGTFDVSPVFNYGTGGEIVAYRVEGSPRTTGFEINPTRILTSMLVDNIHDVTIAGGDLTLSSAGTAATLTNGRVITGSNTLILNSATATVTRTNGYVDGNLQKTYSTAANKIFEVGTANGYSPVAANVTGGSFPATFTAKAIQGGAPYVFGPNKLERYWTLDGSGLTANLTFTYLPTDVMGTLSNYQFVKNDAGIVSILPPAGTPTTTTAVINGVSAFSDWTLAEPASVPSPTPSSTPFPSPSATPFLTPTPTATATPPASTITISGTIDYCSNPTSSPVANVVLTLTGSAIGTTLSDAAGNYVFPSLPAGGSYNVTAAKGALTAGSAGISTVDVIAIQRHYLLIAPLTGCRLTAADVNNDASVSTVDIVAVQRFFLGLTSGTANVGKYNFAPQVRSYSNLTSDQVDQNYDTSVFGDVASPFADRPAEQLGEQ